MYKKRLRSVQDYFKSLMLSDLISLNKTLSKYSVNNRAKSEIKDISKIRDSLFAGYYIKDSFVIKLIDCKNHSFYRVIFEGKLLYEETVKFDNKGKIIFTGNCEFCDLVDKISFKKNNESIASFALKERKKKIKGILINGKLYNYESFVRGATYEKDSFFNINTEHSVQKQDYLDIKVFYENHQEKRKISFGTDDNPYFFDLNGHFKIDNNKVMIDKGLYQKQIPWSLFVKFVDGLGTEIAFPDLDEYIFNKPIECAIIVDALDNEWYC